MKKNDSKKQDVPNDCGGCFVNTNLVDNKEFAQEMRKQGYTLKDGMWVPKECV